MVRHARSFDPAGDYRVSDVAGPGCFADGCFDLVLSAFTFDNIPTVERKVEWFAEFRRVLTDGGRIVNILSSPEIYWNDWASFTPRDFPENRRARSGDTVQIIVTALEDHRPVVDVLFTDEAYRDVYARAGLSVVDVHRPLARGGADCMGERDGEGAVGDLCIEEAHVAGIGAPTRHFHNAFDGHPR